MGNESSKFEIEKLRIAHELKDTKSALDLKSKTIEGNFNLKMKELENTGQDNLKRAEALIAFVEKKSSTPEDVLELAGIQLLSTDFNESKAELLKIIYSRRKSLSSLKSKTDHLEEAKQEEIPSSSSQTGHAVKANENKFSSPNSETDHFGQAQKEKNSNSKSKIGHDGQANENKIVDIGCKNIEEN